ncbi:putative mitochondrial protein [Nicotiana attenuata]|uniref:Mitochondrial protein n=1 Tax=Nicotiana attenuata TaxID=49451 RepID=A0A314L8G5_NICAT|nr:putative mitochondrial protein [Nicotiana attenuata]
MTETIKKLESNDFKMDELYHKFDIMMDKIFINKDEILGSAPRGSHHVEGSGSKIRMVEPHEQPIGRFHSSNSTSKVDCPYFKDGDPRSWMRKCERHFHYNHITDPHHKIKTIFLHLNGKAELWYFSYQVSRGRFKRIEQIGSVTEYLENFEDIKTWVLIKHPTIPEEFFLGFFIEGIKEEIRHTIKMLDPFSLSQAIEKARHKEELLESMSRKNRGSGGKSAAQYSMASDASGSRTSNFTLKEGNPNSTISANKLFEAGKARGECYRLQVSVKGKRVDLKGFSKEGKLQAMTASRVKQLLKKGQVIWAHLLTITATEVKNVTAIPAEIRSVLEDFPVYSSFVETHALYLRKVMEVLQKEQLYAKPSKCSFGQDKVEYLGHIISGKGVSTDPSKIEAMVSWPVPKNVKALRGFLGLIGYYRRFVKSYGIISKPLTNLLKKNSFQWNAEAELASAVERGHGISSSIGFSRFYQAIHYGDRCLLHWHGTCVDARGQTYSLFQQGLSTQK